MNAKILPIEPSCGGSPAAPKPTLARTPSVKGCPAWTRTRIRRSKVSRATGCTTGQRRARGENTRRARLCVPHERASQQVEGGDGGAALDRLAGRRERQRSG